MSTKIFTGFVMPDSDLDRAYRLAHKFRAYVLEWTRTMTIRWYAGQCTRRLDNAAWHRKDCPAPLSTVAMELLDRQVGHTKNVERGREQAKGLEAAFRRRCENWDFSAAAAGIIA